MLALFQRWTPLAAVVGGVVFVVVLVVVAFYPNSAVWIGLVIPFLLLTVADLGLGGRLRGQGGPWVERAGLLAGVSGVALVVLFIVTSFEANYDPAAPINLLFIVVFVLWSAANLIIAVALITSRAMSPVGPWLTILGAVGAIAIAVLDSSTTAPIAILPVALFGLGWIVIGRAHELASPAS